MYGEEGINEPCGLMHLEKRRDGDTAKGNEQMSGAEDITKHEKTSARQPPGFFQCFPSIRIIA